MKKQLLKIGAACLALAVSANVMAQDGEATILNAGSMEVTIDGDAGEWADVEKNAIEVAFQTEAATVNSATWSAIWTDEGIYVLVEVEDDVWMPSWLSGKNSWESDVLELYFDTTDPRQDGQGASTNAGNWQVAPNFSETAPGVAVTEDNGVVHADMYDTEGAYTVEYMVPFSAIPDNNAAVIDPWVTTVIGFDVTVIDLDATDGTRQRVNWSNAGGIDESWANMDDCGVITFSPDEVGTSINSKVSKVNILASTVVTDRIELTTAVKEVKVLNTIGQVVKTSVNVSDLNNGVYILVAKTAKGETIANRFLKK